MSDERTMLRESACSFLDKWSASSSIRAIADASSGLDTEMWARFVEMGWTALLVPEAVGGLGAALGDVIVIAAELGAHVTPSPFLSSAVLVPTALRGLRNDQAVGVLGELVEGSALATVAFWGPAGEGEERSIRARAARDPAAGWRLNGSVSYVPDLTTAQSVLVAGRTDEEESIVFLVRTDAAGVVVKPVDLIDRTRRVGELNLQSVEVGAEDVLARGDDASRLISRTLRVGNLVLAADAVGTANRALDLAVGYAKQRVQFGRLIGSFQAVKHTLADMFASVQVATAGIEGAADILEQDDTSRIIASATSYAKDTGVKVTGDSIQMHGGIGFTWEYDSHLLLKRALFDEVFLGSASSHRDAIALALLD